MLKVFLGLALLASVFSVSSFATIGVYDYIPGTIATLETLNTAAVKVNINGVTKEATLVVPYIKTDTSTTEVVLVSTSTVEYSYTFPEGTTRFQIQAREEQALLYSFISGSILAGNYFTIKSDRAYWEKDLFLNGLTIYLGSSTSEAVNAEIQSWGY